MSGIAQHVRVDNARQDPSLRCGLRAVAIFLLPFSSPLFTCAQMHSASAESLRWLRPDRRRDRTALDGEILFDMKG